MIKSSKGEKKIEELFRKNGISYVREMSFEDLKGKKKSHLRYDFGIFVNGKLLFCLEVDGQQHFKYTPHFHKKYSDFLKQQERDRKKNSYCLAHSIPLIRIPYWEIDNITLNEILTNPKYRVKTIYHNDMLRG